MGKANAYASLVVSAFCALLAAAAIYFIVRVARLDLARGAIRATTWAGVILIGLNLLLILVRFRSSLREVRRLRRRSGGRCVECGYDLRGSTDRCPECGKAIE